MHRSSERESREFCFFLLVSMPLSPCSPCNSFVWLINCKPGQADWLQSRPTNASSQALDEKVRQSTRVEYNAPASARPQMEATRYLDGTNGWVCLVDAAKKRKWARDPAALTSVVAFLGLTNRAARGRA